MPADKNRAIQGRKFWKDNAVFVSILLMLASLLLPRAALSCSLILFLFLTLFRNDFRRQWRSFRADPYAVGFTLLFLIPFFSGFWSENKVEWLHVLRLKLPLLLFPLAFAGSWRLSEKQERVVAFSFLAVLTLGCGWSLVDYALHPAAINAGYLKAKTLRTPLGDDHVRFSWLVASGVIGCFFFRRVFQTRWSRYFLPALAAFFTTYLYLLSVRTGLGALSLFFLLYAGWLLRQKGGRTPALLLLSTLVALPLLAYWLVPTFQNRVRYLVYDLSYVQKNEYLPGANDGARVLSIRAGWQLLRENPLGVGAGDIATERDRWYAATVPQILPSDQLNPCSEWLLYGAMAGWPGVVLFTLVMLLPFVYPPNGHRLYWVAFHAAAAFSFLFDMGLEVQYGVFLYGFLSFWWRRMMEEKAGIVNRE